MSTAAIEQLLELPADVLAEAAAEPVTLAEMRRVVDAEARRIEQSERAWMAVKDRARPAPLRGELRRAHVFSRIDALIALVASDPVMSGRLKELTRGR